MELTPEQLELLKGLAIAFGGQQPPQQEVKIDTLFEEPDEEVEEEDEYVSSSTSTAELLKNVNRNKLSSEGKFFYDLMNTMASESKERELISMVRNAGLSESHRMVVEKLVKHKASEKEIQEQITAFKNEEKLYAKQSGGGMGFLIGKNSSFGSKNGKSKDERDRDWGAKLAMSQGYGFKK